jgi:hypothetical protein
LLLLFLSVICRKFYLCKLSFSLFSSFFKATLISILLANQKSLLIIEKTVFKISLIKKSFILFKFQFASSFDLSINKNTFELEISCFYGSFNHFPFFPNPFKYASILNVFKSTLSVRFSIDKLSSIYSFFSDKNTLIMRNKIVCHLQQLSFIIDIRSKYTT